MNGLLTDLYELTMAAGYFETGKTDEKATFELTFRRLPANRNFILVAGLPQLVEYLLNLSFTDAEVEYLPGSRSSAKSRRLSGTTCACFASRAISSRCPRGRLHSRMSPSR